MSPLPHKGPRLSEIEAKDIENDEHSYYRRHAFFY